MGSPAIARIIAKTGLSRLPVALTEELSPSDLQSLLLSVYRQRVRAIHEPEVLAQAERSALTAPSNIDARLLNRFDQIAFTAADGFEAIELSPACPLGATYVLGGIDQSNVLTTIRNTEVLADCTNAMAIECARRRRKIAERSKLPALRLCSSHRVMRLQPFTAPGQTAHFRLFGLVSAGRDEGSHAFEIRHLAEHIRFYLELFRALNGNGFSLEAPLVELSDLTITETALNSYGVTREDLRGRVRAHLPESSERLLAERGITLPADVVDPAIELKDMAERLQLTMQMSRLASLKERVVDPLQNVYPEARFRFNFARLAGLSYYTGLCLRICPLAPDGARYPVADGGFTDWTARLLQDRKERLLTSGIGSEFVCRRYRAAP
jgi:hypothetical protein